MPKVGPHGQPHQYVPWAPPLDWGPLGVFIPDVIYTPTWFYAAAMRHFRAMSLLSEYEVSFCRLSVDTQLAKSSHPRINIALLLLIQSKRWVFDWIGLDNSCLNKFQAPDSFLNAGRNKFKNSIQVIVTLKGTGQSQTAAFFRRRARQDRAKWADAACAGNDAAPSCSTSTSSESSSGRDIALMAWSGLTTSDTSASIFALGSSVSATVCRATSDINCTDKTRAPMPSVAEDAAAAVAGEKSSKWWWSCKLSKKAAAPSAKTIDDPEKQGPVLPSGMRRAPCGCSRPFTAGVGQGLHCAAHPLLPAHAAHHVRAREAAAAPLTWVITRQLGVQFGCEHHQQQRDFPCTLSLSPTPSPSLLSLSSSHEWFKCQWGRGRVPAAPPITAPSPSPSTARPPPRLPPPCTPPPPLPTRTPPPRPAAAASSALAGAPTARRAARTRAAPSVAEHEGTAVSSTSYDFDFAGDGDGDGRGRGPSAYGATLCLRTRSERRFSVSQSTPAPSLGLGDTGGRGADTPAAALTVKAGCRRPARRAPERVVRLPRSPALAAVRAPAFNNAQRDVGARVHARYAPFAQAQGTCPRRVYKPRGHVRAWSMSPESFVRGGSMSPDFAYLQGRGHTPMVEDKLLYASAPTSRAANDTALAPAGGHLMPTFRRVSRRPDGVPCWGVIRHHELHHVLAIVQDVHDQHVQQLRRITTSSSVIIPNFNAVLTVKQVQGTGCMPGFFLLNGACVASAEQQQRR
ncbi:hypothetical protein B0H11DRAFT_1943356, partial [Mycena galericulata]